MPPLTELLLDALDKKMLGARLDDIYHRDRSRPAIFLLCTHEWGNIGDLAINLNEIVFLEKNFPGQPVHPISRSALAANWQRVIATIGPDDLIALHGGGSMGDIWPHEEVARVAVVEQFTENPFISLPQSIHFTNAAKQARSMRAYSAHPRFLLAVRDDRSAEIARAHLPGTQVVRTQDIVLRHVYPFAFQPESDRVLFVQRDDLEKRQASHIDTLREALLAGDTAVDRTDTTVPQLPFSNTELAAKLVYQKIDELRASALVITDRLHGAIFALLSGTPVIVFENSYGKIGGALAHLAPTLGERLLFADDLALNEVIERADHMARLPAATLRPHTVLAGAHADFDAVVTSFWGV